MGTNLNKFLEQTIKHFPLGTLLAGIFGGTKKTKSVCGVD